MKIIWIDVNNKANETQYNMKLTGKKQIEEHYGLKMQVLHELTTEGILKSTTYTEDGNNVIMEAFRELKEGDKLLDVTMLTKTV